MSSEMSAWDEIINDTRKLASSFQEEEGEVVRLEKLALLTLEKQNVSVPPKPPPFPDTEAELNRYQQVDAIDSKIVTDPPCVSTSFREEIRPVPEVQTTGYDEALLRFIDNKLQEQSHDNETLRMEVRQLREHCRHQQAASELLMSKYRQHTSELTRLKTEADLKVISTRKDALELITEIRGKHLKVVSKMENALKTGLNVDENIFLRNEEMISQLAMENRTLRELLAVSDDADATLRSLYRQTEDKSVQTEDCKHAVMVAIENNHLTKMAEGDFATFRPEETEKEDYFSDDSGSFYSALDGDSEYSDSS